MSSRKLPGRPGPRLLGKPDDGLRFQSLWLSLSALLLSVVAISLMVLLIGRDPLKVIVSLVQGSGWLPKPRYAAGRSMLTDFLGMLDAMTPMLFAAIAVAVAFKAGLFNIGVSGQMLLSGWLATVLIGYSGLAAVIAKPLVLTIGLLAGTALALLAGWLKARFNIHEVVSTIMLNYIVQSLVGFAVKGFYLDPVSRQSRAVSAASRLTLIDLPIGDVNARIPLCFGLALLMALAYYLLLSQTRLGFEIKVVGSNRQAAGYAGISVDKTVLSAMALSGAAAGLAGVTYYLGYQNSIMPGELTSVGFDSIAVSMLANSNPLACVLSSLLITGLNYGSNYMSSTANVSAYICSLMTGIVLLFSAASGYFNRLARARVTRARRARAGGPEGGTDSPEAS